MSKSQILVIGSGAAGISSATWLESLHQPYDWVGQKFGGILHRVSNRIENLPPERYENGSELSRKFELYLREMSNSPRELAVSRLEKLGSRWNVFFSDGSNQTYSAVILATGTRYRRLGIEGESEGLDAGWVSQSSAKDARRFAGSAVAVIGGGDAAFENALRLSAAGCEVTLIRRSEPGARAAFVDEVRNHDSIEEIAPANAIRFERHGETTTIYLDNDQTLEVSGVFVRIGVETVIPDFSDSSPDVDASGRLVTDISQATSLEGIFAAGDLTIVEPQGVASAMGQGAIAARSATSLVSH